MKLLIASDLHGSAYYTKKLFERAERENPDKILLLGDIYYHGPRNPFPKDYAPAQVADILNRNKDMLIVIKGNCDSEVDQMISEFDFVESYWTLDLAYNKLVCTHGHKMDKEDLPSLNKGDILAFGHTHQGVIKNKDGILYINPGSLSLPKQNSTNSYIIIQKANIWLKNLSNDILDYILWQI